MISHLIRCIAIIYWIFKSVWQFKMPVQKKCGNLLNAPCISLTLYTTTPKVHSVTSYLLWKELYLNLITVASTLYSQCLSVIHYMYLLSNNVFLSLIFFRWLFLLDFQHVSNWNFWPTDIIMYLVDFNYQFIDYWFELSIYGQHNV